MTAALKSEVAWMDKGTALIESTMNEAYRLYSQLRDGGVDRKTVDAALTVAKDVHEVKKEYFLLMRGISEALSEESPRDGMNLGELMEIMVRSGERTARAQGKQVGFTTPAPLSHVHLPQPHQQRRGGCGGGGDPNRLDRVERGGELLLPGG